MSGHIRVFVIVLGLLTVQLSAQEPEGIVIEVPKDDLGEVNDAFQEHFFEALKQKAIENYGKAVDALIQCLALRPEEAVVYLELGKNFNALGAFPEAAAYLERGRRVAPGNQAILSELYNTYYLSKDFGNALSVVKELAKQDDSYKEDLVNLYIMNEQFDAALDLLDSLESQYGSNSYREGLRRQIYARTGNLDAQINDLEQGIAKNPENEQEYLNLIFVYSENGQHEKAFETAQELLRIHPSSELVHLALYKFHISRSESEQAVNSMKILLKSDQIDELTKYQALNDFLLYVSEDPALEKELVELVEIFSSKEGNTKVYQQLGTFFLEKGRKQQALEYFTLALENSDLEFDLLREVIHLQWEMGHYDRVAELGAEGLEIFPTQVWLYLISAKAQNELGNSASAEDLLLSAEDFLLEEGDLAIAIYEELAKTYSLIGEPEKASVYLEKAKKIKNQQSNE